MTSSSSASSAVFARMGETGVVGLAHAEAGVLLAPFSDSIDDDELTPIPDSELTDVQRLQKLVLHAEAMIESGRVTPEEFDDLADRVVAVCEAYAQAQTIRSATGDAQRSAGALGHDELAELQGLSTELESRAREAAEFADSEHASLAARVLGFRARSSRQNAQDSLERLRRISLSAPKFGRDTSGLAQ